MKIFLATLASPKFTSNAEVLISADNVKHAMEKIVQQKKFAQANLTVDNIVSIKKVLIDEVVWL